MVTDSCMVLYGNSVFLAGIKAGLERASTLELIALEAGNPDAADLIRMRRPQAVLFDLSQAQPDFATPLLLEQPGLMLIGVDPSRDELLVLCSYPVQALSVPDLVRLIIEELPSPNGARRGAEGVHS